MRSKLSGWGRTLLLSVGIGTVVLGIGGRLGMHLFAQLTTGTGGFTVGGTVTVIALGAASGALGGLILVAARAVFHRWPPMTSLVYWGTLIALTLRGLKPLDPLRIAIFLPLGILFGIVLQWRSWQFRLPRAEPPITETR